MTTVTICSDSGAQEHKISHCFHFFPIYLPWSDRPRYHDLNFSNVEFQGSFCTLLFHPHQEALSALRAQEFHLEGWNHWLLWDPCQQIWQEMLHFSQQIRHRAGVFWFKATVLHSYPPPPPPTLSLWLCSLGWKVSTEDSRKGSGSLFYFIFYYFF